MFYVISGWDNKGNQCVEVHKANSDKEAEHLFLVSIGGGEVNEILDIIEENFCKKANKKTYPCDGPDGFCPFDAVGGMDCYNLCGLCCDESETEDDYDYDDDEVI